MSDVAERIQFILKRENLTYGQFAERIGVAASAISHFVNRRNKPSLDALAYSLHSRTYHPIGFCLVLGIF